MSHHVKTELGGTNEGQFTRRDTNHKLRKRNNAQTHNCLMLQNVRTQIFGTIKTAPAGRRIP